MTESVLQDTTSRSYGRIKGVRLGKNDQISVFCSKSVFRYGGITSHIFRGLAALEPPPPEKYFVHFVRNLSRIPKLFFSHSSIKTEEVLCFFLYIYIYIYLYIYNKLSPKWKKIQEQKVFLFRFYILCDNFSKIGPIIKKWGAKGVHI